MAVPSSSPGYQASRMASAFFAAQFTDKAEAVQSTPPPISCRPFDGFQQVFLVLGQIEAGAVAALEAGQVDVHLFAFQREVMPTTAITTSAFRAAATARAWGASDGEMPAHEANPGRTGAGGLFHAQGVARSFCSAISTVLNSLGFLADRPGKTSVSSSHILVLSVSTRDSIEATFSSGTR